MLRFLSFNMLLQFNKNVKPVLTMNPPPIIPNSAFAHLFPAVIVISLLLAFLPGCATQPSSFEASWAAPVGIGMNPLNYGELH